MTCTSSGLSVGCSTGIAGVSHGKRIIHSMRIEAIVVVYLVAIDWYLCVHHILHKLMAHAGLN